MRLLLIGYVRMGKLVDQLSDSFGCEVAERLDIDTPALAAPLRQLSGGNQQRVLLARELQGPPRVLIASSPTQGLDVASALYVHQIIRRLRDTGSAIVLISEDLDEIGAISDRVFVMYEGRIVFERETEQCDAESLGLAMSGIST